MARRRPFLLIVVVVGIIFPMWACRHCSLLNPALAVALGVQSWPSSKLWLRLICGVVCATSSQSMYLTYLLTRE